MSDSLDRADQEYQDRHETIDVADLRDVEVEYTGNPDDLPDAMLVSACWSNGEPLTDIERENVAEDNPDWVQEMAMGNND
jgi:hypothetical protein